jgi:hypothetical protein
MPRDNRECAPHVARNESVGLSLHWVRQLGEAFSKMPRRDNHREIGEVEVVVFKSASRYGRMSPTQPALQRIPLDPEYKR